MNPVEAFVEATKVRAKAYVYIFDAMVDEIGEEKAKKIFSKATYNMGKDKIENLTDEEKKSAIVFGRGLIK